MFEKLIAKLTDFSKNEDGATAIEYGLIAGLIFVVIIGSVKSMMAGQDSQYKQISSSIDTAISGSP